ncbi:MAG TPA: FkbM family methyltransferase [Candidatus Methylacidiphilales bacterium]|jgi:hypothetical protein|nr:FkbM family methyltransferase [Candidatus Methylacidiphilales bacterium]
MNWHTTPVLLDHAYREPLAQLLSLMAPQHAVSAAKRRYGSRHDGGYILLDDFASITGAFSLGISSNVKWDLAMAEKGLPVWQYDYTVDGPPDAHPNFEFHKVRIGQEEEDVTPTRSLSRLISERPPGDLILKMDIEGAEWESFAGMAPDQLKAFRQIVLEFHDFSRVTDPAWRELAMTALQHLNRHHAVCHVHGNNFAPLVRAGDIAVPASLEVSYARRDAYELVPATETFPGPLDRPCNPYRPDVPLGTFTFR